MTQNDMIRRHMETVGPITQIEATERFGCTRLAARIADLRAEGMRIEKVMVPVPNRYGDIVYVARYSARRNQNGVE